MGCEETMSKSGYEHLCQEETRRGGFSEGGGYDRMNFVRYEPCFKPATTSVEFYARNGQRTMCKRHANLQKRQRDETNARQKMAEDVIASHKQGEHNGNTEEWATRKPSRYVCPYCYELYVESTKTKEIG